MSDTGNNEDATRTASSKKRPRSDDDDDDGGVFARLRQWIVAAPENGGGSGYVHPSVTWNAGTRTLSTTTAIAVDTKVLEIPAACIVNHWDVAQTALTATSTTNGGASADADDKQDNVLEKLVDDETKKDGDAFFHQVSDLLVAWHVATRPSALAPYLATLDADAVARALPRHWPDDARRRWLGGSPTNGRIDRQKAGVGADYVELRRRLVSSSSHPTENGNSNGDNCSIPTRQAFDQALAVVTSRAFAGPSCAATTSPLSSSGSCLIPLLDLCNHQRGCSTTGTARKNLRYAWNHRRDDDDNGGGGVSMVVHAATAIAAGDVLRITYGAQSNAQLLLNYGFCLPPAVNVEPDGSSNNVYELTVSLPSTTTTTAAKANKDKTIFLRMGPKSYTYGPLVQVLEALGPVRNKDDGNNPRKDEASVGGDQDEDMEAFLNECEQGDEDGMDDMYGNGPIYGGEEDEEEEDAEQEKQRDRQALQAFAHRLEELLQAYPSLSSSDDNDSKADSKDDHDNENIKATYARFLVESEQEILRFYQAMVAQLLVKLGAQESSTPSNGKSTLSSMQNEQIQSLVEAFVQIRYSPF